MRSVLFVTSDGCGILLTDLGTYSTEGQADGHRSRWSAWNILWTAAAKVESLVETMVRFAEAISCTSYKHSAKHLSVCTSGGCQQLTDARSVMKLCLIQPTVSSPSMFFQVSPDFCGFSEYRFWGQLEGAYSPAPSCSKQILAPHINIFQKVRTKKI